MPTPSPEIIENRGEEISSLLDQTIETNRGSFVVKEVGYVGNQIRIKLEQKSATFVLFFDARLSKQQLIAAVKDHFRIVL